MQPTASSIERAIACPASAVLPAIQTTNAMAERGTALHTFIAEAIESGRECALELVPKQYRRDAEAINIEELRAMFNGAEVFYEHAFRWNTRSDKADYLGMITERKYPPLDAFDIVGTADLYACQDDEMLIVDIKTGKWPVTAAANNWQLRTLAVMASRAFGMGSASVAIAKPRMGTWKVDRATFHAFDLDGFADELREMTERVAKMQDEYTVGVIPDVYPSEKACEWCPCRKACPMPAPKRWGKAA